MIECQTDNNGEKIYRYVKPTSEDFFERLRDLYTIFRNFLLILNTPLESVKIDTAVLQQIIIRVDKRKDYYLIYHGTQISEVRKSAAMAYWILKFKPFSLVSGSENDPGMNINNGFATYVMFCAISVAVHKTTGGQRDFVVREEYSQKLQYALIHWDLSMEALMLLVETLYESAIG